MENHQCALGIETKAISLRMKVKTIRGGSSDWKRRLLSSSTIPGFGKAQDATYRVTGSEFLVSSDGARLTAGLWNISSRSLPVVVELKGFGFQNELMKS